MAESKNQIGIKNRGVSSMRLLSFFKRPKHDFDMYMKIEDGKMSGMGGLGERTVKIQIFGIVCRKCKRVFKIIPGGIIHDPEMDRIMKPDAIMEEHASMDINEKEQLVKDLEAEGINVGYCKG